MRRSKKLHITRKTLILGIIGALLLAGGGVFAYRQTRPDKTPAQTSPTPTTTTSGDDEINLDPPTEEEKTETEQHKDDLAKPADPGTGQPGGSKAVTVTIVDASQYGQEVEVRAFASGVYEDGGTCKMVFTQGSRTVSKQTAGFKDATTTSCTPLTVARSEFPVAGDWTVTVTYTSSTSSGSANKTVRIQ